MSDPTAPGAMLVCFAVPDESRLFTKLLQSRRTMRVERQHPFPTVFGELGGRSLIVTHTGVGDSAISQRHLADVLLEWGSSLRGAISAGYAGALTPAMAVADLVLGENYSSLPWTEKARARLAGEPVHIGTLRTEPAAVESAQRKQALHQATGALAVDMETAWIAEACAEAGLPLLSLRVVSDAADQDFPVPGRILYDAGRQRPRYLALPAWLALHPGRIAPFVRFVRGLGPARERLTRALQTVLSDL